ncbi:MAG: Antitoxin [Deltaproteobacteria bacterium]|nr:Antitoxin [Deltaproteobacteria bacterium]
MITAGVKEARQHFTEYLSRVEKGEEVIITKREEPVAKISAIQRKAKGRLLSHKELRDSIMAKGKPLSEIVVESRQEERY